MLLFGFESEGHQTGNSGAAQSSLMMDDYTLPFWIYLGVLTMIVGGAMKKILASHLSTASTLVAWLGATVLVERLWAFCLPAVLLLALLGLGCCLYSTARAIPPPVTLPVHGKAVFITGKKGTPSTLSGVRLCAPSLGSFLTQSFKPSALQGKQLHI